jgi:hypothetical protein
VEYARFVLPLDREERAAALALSTIGRRRDLAAVRVFEERGGGSDSGADFAKPEQFCAANKSLRGG